VSRPRVLFVCTANAARSQMAEGMLRTLAGDRFEVHSAGIYPRQVDELAVAAMKERDIDISKQRSKGVEEFLDKSDFSYVITLCGHAERACPAFPGGTVRLHWPVPDPALAVGSLEERLQEFRDVRDQIEALIEAWLAAEAE
jgi:arsenate reductase (thioredoxin)